MSSGPPYAKDNEGGKLGGARADFVASLGRKVNDSRELLGVLEDDPSSKGARDELRRRLHALGAGARLLRFDAMAAQLADALAVLDRSALVGTMREQDVVFVAQVIDDLPALAWGEVPPREPTAGATEEADEPQGVLPISTLVVGDEELADALTEDSALRARAFECERTGDVQVALELARAYAPDVMIIDADVPRASDLVEALLDDPMTEPVPIVVVGTFRTTDEAARFVALGVAKALHKPFAPDALRRVCDEILDAREGRTVRVTLGEPTLEQLAERLSQELKRALIDSVDRPALSCRVPLGEGTEVLGALWGAIARVQEIVSQKTGGAIRFGGDAPEGSIALAPMMHHDVAGADRLAGRGRGAAADVRLAGRRVLVADDDPGVTWFISDLLRTAGCEVHEALDGLQALEIAFRVQPELVVSDILMPGMDGFALSRALHRDVALRDTPVILLSWKEDLLQRVRELGASAAAYMRKESDSRAILARVREVLRPRARIEMRLRGDGEVRGRLDGITARLLLELVGSIRRDARVAVRDATYLYEIEVRDGAPRRASRTAADGQYSSGERAVASLLGVATGRFIVSPSQEPVRAEMTGSLTELLAKPIAAARGALAAATGARTMHVERIAIDEAALEEYLRATPDPARSLIKRIAKGASPRQMLLAGEVAPGLFEDFVCDLAARGAIRAVEGANGADFLTPAVEAAIAVLRGAPKPMRTVPPNARPSAPAPPILVRSAASQTRPAPPMRPVDVEASKPTTPPPSSGPVVDAGDAVPSSLEDAVMRELSDRSPDPGATHVPTSNPPPIIEPSALRKRSSNPPEQEEVEEVDSLYDHGWDESLPSLPPDAMVPAATSGEEVAAAKHLSSEKVATVPPAAPVPDATPLSPPLELLPELTPELLPELSLEPSHDTEAAAPVAEKTAPAPPVAPEAPAPPTPPPPPPQSKLDKTQPLPIPPPRPAPRPAPKAAPQPEAKAAQAVAAPASEKLPRRRPLWGFVLAFGALVAVVAAALNATRADPAPEPAEPESATAAPPPVPTPSTPPSAPPSAAPSASSAAPSGSADDLPPGAEVPPGFGLIQVKAAPGAKVRIDGAIAGAGPTVSMVAAPGPHDIRIEKDGREQMKRILVVSAGKAVRFDTALPP